jgi:hypothetical protein
MLAYREALEEQGFVISVQSLLSDEYLQRLYSGSGRNRLSVAAAYWRRMVSLAGRHGPRLVWLEKELLPYAPAALEWTLLAGSAYVVDIDDAVFHTYDEHPSGLVRHLLGDKIDRIFRRSALVTAGCAYLEQRAHAAGAAWVEPFPTVVDLRTYAPDWTATHAGVTVGWIGTPATQSFLQPVAPVLAEVLGSGGRLVTVGAKYPQPLFTTHEQQGWSKDAEVRQLQQFDVGIMPLADAPFERGKCGYKLIQYMAVGLPVIASPVGANRDIVRHGENGFLADGPDEWRAALLRLRDDPELRRRMGRAGRARVEARYSLQVTAPRLCAWLGEIAERQRAQDG